MKRLCLIFALFCGCFAQPQAPPPRSPNQRPSEPSPEGTPDAKTQREMIIKDDYKKNLKEAAELLKLAEDLKEDLENSDKNIVSVKAIKKTEDIEKLERSIRSRLKRY
jgi:hypothetical protein